MTYRSSETPATFFQARRTKPVKIMILAPKSGERRTIALWSAGGAWQVIPPGDTWGEWTREDLPPGPAGPFGGARLTRPYDISPPPPTPEQERDRADRPDWYPWGDWPTTPDPTLPGGFFHPGAYEGMDDWIDIDPHPMWDWGLPEPTPPDPPDMLEPIPTEWIIIGLFVLLAMASGTE